MHGKIEQIVRARGFPPQRPVSGSMHRRPFQVVSPLRGIAGGKVEMPWGAPRLCSRGLKHIPNPGMHIYKCDRFAVDGKPVGRAGPESRAGPEGRAANAKGRMQPMP